MPAQPLTLFAIPKAFERHIGIAQANAIRSWLALRPRPRVILIGDDPGTAETAAELGVEHVPQVERNEFGTPLLGSAFALAHARVSEGLMVFINADIILTGGFSRAVAALPPGDVLMIGQRTNMYVRHSIDFADPDWEATLRRRVAVKGTLNGPTAIDYFVFPHTLFREVPRFAVGRGWWDHWLVAEAIRAGATLVDATPTVLAVHQNHDFLAGEEAIRNLALYGRATDSISTALASLVIEDGRLRPRPPARRRPIVEALRQLGRAVLRRPEAAR